MATFSSPEFGKADFVLLDEVTEEHFMRNLKHRFQKGKIYTYIGKGGPCLKLLTVYRVDGSCLEIGADEYLLGWVRDAHERQTSSVGGGKEQFTAALVHSQGSCFIFVAISP